MKVPVPVLEIRLVLGNPVQNLWLTAGQPLVLDILPPKKLFSKIPVLVLGLAPGQVPVPELGLVLDSVLVPASELDTKSDPVPGQVLLT